MLFLPKKHYLIEFGGTSDKPQVRDILQTHWHVLLKNVKTVKGEGTAKKELSRLQARKRTQDYTAWFFLGVITDQGEAEI